jgi:hypothetical protein
VRLLVLSNIPGSVDRIVDILQTHSNIIAKEASMAESTMASMVAEQLKNRSYDQAIVVARDPIQAGILLNKKDGVQAVVCHSIDDVRLAKENGANVIVIRNMSSDSAAEVIAQAAGMSARGIKMPQIRMPESLLPQQQPKQQEKEPQKRGILVSRKAKKPEPEEEEPRRGSHSGKMMDKIKDYLGIV